MKILFFHSANLEAPKANLHQVVHMCNAFADNFASVKLFLHGEEVSNESAKEKIESLYGKIRFSLSIRKKLFSETFDNYFFHKPLKRIISREQPNLIFCRSHLILNTCIKSGLPVIFESHNAILHNRLKFLNSVFTKYIARKALCADNFAMVAISEALSNHWINAGVPQSKIIALHDGFDKGMFDRQLTKEAARAELGINPLKKIITYTGSLYPNREIENIIQLASLFPQLYFLIVGGPEEQRLHYQEQSKDKGLQNICFTGQVAHKIIPLYLYASDVLLALWSNKVSTINYCSPLKVFEYMAAGRIIVAQGFPTILEVLKHRVNALIAEPTSFRDLEKNVKIAVSDECPVDLAKNARKLAFGYYSWLTRAKSIIMLYQKITSNKM